jgi:hypothetical protein
MIEIAIALGVIGFALVAIIGVLPFGLNVQKESHQDTVISQDAPFFLAAIRNGGIPGTNVSNTSLDFLTNYVEQITIIATTSGGTNTTPFTNFANGKTILGLLTTPEYYYPPGAVPGKDPAFQTNTVVARVRALSGNALEQNGANSVVAFRYNMYVEVAPFTSSLEVANNGNLANDLYDIHLKFSWPVAGIAPNFTVGPGRAHFRTMVSGQLLQYNPSGQAYWFMQPYNFQPLNKNTIL